MSQEQRTDALYLLTKRAFFENTAASITDERKLRRIQRDRFLEKANDLFSRYPYSNEQFPRREDYPFVEKITKPVEVVVEGKTLLIHVVRFVQKYEGVRETLDISTNIVGREPESVNLKRLFGIEQWVNFLPSQRVKQTQIRNLRGKIASNQDMQEGLNAIFMIESLLSLELS